MKKEDGQAIVEIALILPILLMMFCGIIDFGRILYSLLHLNMVNQEAVRMAGLGKVDTQIVQYVGGQFNPSNIGAIKVNISPNDANRKSGDYVTVGVTYEVKYITPIIKAILPSPFIVSAKSTIRVE